MHPLALGYQTLGRAARVLPRPAAYAAARRLMDAVYLGWPRGRNAARRNAELLLPFVNWSGDAPSLARAQFQRYGEYLVDAIRLDELTPAKCFEAVGGHDPVWAEHWMQLEEWYQRRPVLFAVIHFGNWDILGGAFTDRIGPSMVLVDDLGHPALNRAIQDQRARLGMTPASGRRGLRQIIDHLNDNGTAAILFDRPPRPNEQTTTETLFGQEIALPNEIHRIAELTGAKLIPLAATRQGHDLRFTPHIDLDHNPAGPLLSAFESPLNSAPDQWYQFRRLMQ
ncbi:MAG: lysophospholipid acyltransferase family protein [Chloroflexota bacterium]|nr:lysophospholipid acyltransferase family protein [Chloroflexota bacterium]MDE2893985.1 lysophospholipid acyltransferase family protein [Chloroflexota bacterium]